MWSWPATPTAQPVVSPVAAAASAVTLPSRRAPGSDRGEDRGREADLADQLLRPDPPLEVEGERARGEREVGGRHARQSPGEVVRDVQPERGAGECLWLVRLQPEQLAKREGRIGREPGQRMQTDLADGRLQPRELGLAAARRTRRWSCRSAGPAGRARRTPRRRSRPRGPGSRAGSRICAVASRSAPQAACQSASGSCSAQPGPRPLDRGRPAALGDRPAIGREHDRPDAAGAGIDATEQRLRRHGVT